MGIIDILLCIWTLTQLFTSINGVYILTSTCEFGTTFQNGSCTMTCDTGTPKTEVQWVNGTITTTVDNSDCGYTGSLPSDYTGACPTSTTYTLTINQIDFCRDTWSWQCTDPFGASVTSNKADVNITVETIVNITKGPTQIECSCVSSQEILLELIMVIGSGQKVVANNSANINGCPLGIQGMLTSLSSSYDKTASHYCQADGVRSQTIGPDHTTDCICQCACTCEQASRIVLIIIIIVLVIVVVAIIAFIVVFCVKHIKTYNDHYRLVIFIVAIVVFIVAVACTIVVFVFAPPVEKPQVEGQDCCCSSCDSDGEKNKELCNDLKLSAAIISILVAVIMLIIITIILIVWFCPGKCGTDKLLNLCNKVPESSHGEAGPRGDNNSSGVGTPLNTVTPSEKPKTKPVENSTGTSSNSGRQQSGNETTGKGTDVRMLQTNATTDSPTKQLPPIDTSKLSHLSPGRPLPPLTKSPDDASESSGKETLKDREENGTGPVTGKKKKKKKKGSKKGGKKLEKESTMPRVDSDGSAGLLD